jgi:hypothetical protein
MRHLLFAVFLALLAACPPEKKPNPEPEPSGRCEIDLDATGHFSRVGAGARAKVIESAAELIGGGYAQGRLGDVLLENDRARFVIQQPTRAIAPIPYGGTLIDADVRRPSGPGRDEYGKLGLIYAFGRTVNATKVEVLADGANGGYAVVAASGTDTVIDYVNVKNVLKQYLGNVELVRDPDEPLPFTITTYYVLSPGESRLRILTAFCNGGKDTVTMQVGDLSEQGGVSEFFNPDGCTNGLGANGCLVDPAGWFGYQADGVAYGYRAYKFTDAKRPATNALLSVAGVAAVLVDGENQAGLLSWVDATATRRPGAFGVLPGDKRTFLRDFFVGRDLGELASVMAAVDGAPRSRLTVTAQRPDGAPAPHARITVKQAETGRMVALLVAGDDGAARVDLSPGNYLVGAGQLGAALEPLSAVSLPSAGTAAVTVRLGATRQLAVSVRDPFGAPLPAKVVVTCPGGPCPTTLTAYRAWHDVEDQPSNIAGIGFAGADGRATLALPPGTYEVFVTRGMEYSAFPDTFPTSGRAVDLTSQDVSLDATLARVVDSTGWMSADLHVHAVGSPDSSVSDAVRVLSFAAEGVDVLVSTDHDFVTDYAPVISQLGLGGQIASLIGAEVTPFDYGHHNAFPLVRRDAINGGSFDWAGGDGPSLRLDQLYAGLRAENPGVVIQMNHPRGAPGGALTMLEVDTATGATHADPAQFRQAPHPEATTTDTRLLSRDFDAIEVMNGMALRTADLNDWMTFLSRGWVKTATGVSDTHVAYTNVGGYARTWLRLGVDAPGDFTPAAFTQAMLGRRAVLSSGPFVTLTARRVENDVAVGPEVGVGDLVSVATGGQLELTVDVQAPEWMQFDAIEIHTHAPGREAFGGVGNETLLPAQAALRRTYDPTALPIEAVPGLNGFDARRVRVRETFRVTASQDTWFIALVRSSSAARPLVPLAWERVSCSGGLCTASASRAFAVTNAILVDADGSGAYDDFPLKPGQPLRAQPARPFGGHPRVPSPEEFEAMLRELLEH